MSTRIDRLGLPNPPPHVGGYENSPRPRSRRREEADFSIAARSTAPDDHNPDDLRPFHLYCDKILFVIPLAAKTLNFGMTS